MPPTSEQLGEPGDAAPHEHSLMAQRLSAEEVAQEKLENEIITLSDDAIEQRLQEITTKITALEHQLVFDDVDDDQALSIGEELRALEDERRGGPPRLRQDKCICLEVVEVGGKGRCL